MTAELRIVVGAVIVDSGHVLAARRARPAHLAGFWEFPGGKVERDETPADALTREVQEELAASIAIIDEVSGDGAPWRISAKYALRLYLASVIRGELQPGADHDLLRWLAPDELESVDWLPSDRQAIPAVRFALETNSDISAAFHRACGGRSRTARVAPQHPSGGQRSRSPCGAQLQCQ